MDNLKKRVRAFDRKRNTPRQMQITERRTEAKKICIDCRRAHDPFEHYNAWFRRMQFLPTEERTPYAPKSPCRDCGGELIEVEW